MRLFRAIKPLIRKPQFLERTPVCFRPLFIASASAKVVDYVNKAEFACLHEHHRIHIFLHLHLGRGVCQQLGEMFFDQIQVITPTVETKNRHLVASFHYCPTLLSCKQVNIFWHELCSDPGPNVFPMPLQLFHGLPDQLFSVWITDMLRLAFEHVANAHQNQRMDVFICE